MYLCVLCLKCQKMIAKLRKKKQKKKKNLTYLCHLACISLQFSCCKISNLNVNDSFKYSINSSFLSKYISFCKDWGNVFHGGNFAFTGHGRGNCLSLDAKNDGSRGRNGSPFFFNCMYFYCFCYNCSFVFALIVFFCVRK